MKGVRQMIKHLFNGKNSWLRLSIPSFLLALFFLLLSFSNVHTETYNLEKFSVAHETIRSPVTIENERKTEQRVREATLDVEDRYQLSMEVAEERLAYIEEVFEAVGEVNQSESGRLSTEEKLNQLNSLLSSAITDELPMEIFRPFLNASENDLNETKELLISSAESYFNEGIRTTDLEGTVDTLKLKIRYSSIPEDLKDESSELGSFALVENAMFDPQATDEARKEAAAQVQPAMIQAGEVIVTEGATITNDIYDELEITGLLNQERNVMPYLGLTLFSLLLGAAILYHFRKMIIEEGLTYRHISVVVLVSAISMSLMKGFSVFDFSNDFLYYLMPAAMGAILIKLLCNERFAVFMSVIFSLMAVVLFNGEVPGALNAHMGIYVLLSQLAGIIFLWNTSDRLFIAKTGVGIALVNCMTISFTVFLSFEKYSWFDWGLFAGYGLISAVLSVILTFGLLPIIESTFDILSDSKLIALANPNHRLLRKILMETPGTYHHSVMVANLSEAACESIGARGLLARVAAYYHDLGKTMRPHYFIENQMGMKNPHDYIKPEQSAAIIISHPYDGAKLLEKEKLPKEIIDIAKQHHGTTLLKYFYYKAKEKESSVNESMFRYPGPKPQTKEAAIVCICDSVEAAVRSLDQPTQEKIDSIVHAIIEDRILDGQLVDCNLTFKELNKLELAICETLQGIFHSRIQYPNQNNLVKEAK
ncbi:HDIG domain-containing protein [Halobacillus sp. A1]|uniref:HD family phosphohydrolase n=1 Tax=Halobacillus sp. A1 TaxID=2880262 RepID=UPI0020A64373|nr:HDIG domain-containing metalloprotein [Halobacillus sp. A1]MCP3030352.1 HDIG domain-containing protein [Halobacillus sp. A1]